MVCLHAWQASASVQQHIKLTLIEPLPNFIALFVFFLIFLKYDKLSASAEITSTSMPTVLVCLELTNLLTIVYMPFKHLERIEAYGRLSRFGTLVNAP